MTEQKSQAETKEIVVDHYRVIDKIASGGMGTVYRAYEPALDRHVALKFLSPELCRDSQIVERFDREAKAAADLQHPNIVSVFFRGRVQGRPYFSMELIEGESLADKVKSGPLPPRLALELMIQAAKGLGVAWRKKRLHRDIKPANLMVTTDNLLKITDFGLAKALDSDSGGLTSANIVVGTPHFISPEQAQGLPVDCRSDIYSLGATFYYLLSGNLPFEADTAMAVLVKLINDPLPSLHDLRPELPTALCSTIERMMAKAPEDRFQDYEELAEHLQAMFQQMPEDIHLPSDVNIPLVSSAQPNTLNALERPPGSSSNMETQAGLPTPLSQPAAQRPSQPAAQRAQGAAQGAAGHTAAQAPTLHSQPAVRTSGRHLSADRHATAAQDSAVAQDGAVAQNGASAQDGPPPAKSRKRWFIVAAVLVLLLIIAGAAKKKKIKKELTLATLPPPAKEQEVEAGLEKLKERLPQPTPYVHVRALVEFTSSYVNLEGAIERLPHDSDERIYAEKFKDTHLWLASLFCEDHIKVCFRLLKALSVDIRKNLRLYDKLLGVEQGVTFAAFRMPPRVNNYRVLRSCLISEVSKHPPPEKWRKDRIDEILQRLPEKPESPEELYRFHHHLSVLARLLKLDLRWHLKGCLNERRKLEKDEFARWELIENCFANLQYTGFQLLRGCPRKTVYRNSLISLLGRINKSLVHRLVNVEEGTDHAVKTTMKLTVFAEQAGLPLRDFLPKELTQFPELKDRKATVEYLERFPSFEADLVSKIIIPTVAIVDNGQWQDPIHNTGNVQFRPLKELRRQFRQNRKRRLGF